MLRTIHLYDELADKFGSSFQFDISSPQEALVALRVSVPGFYKSIKRDGQYAVVVGRDLEGRCLTNQFDFTQSFCLFENDIHIVPLIDGSGGGRSKGIFSIILGVAIIAFAIWAPFAWVAANALTIGMAGATLALGGISSLMTSNPVTTTPTNYASQETIAENRPSFMFSSMTNRGEQGGALPIIYGGPVMVGSIVVSAGLDVVQTGTAGVNDDGSNTPYVAQYCIVTITEYTRYSIFNNYNSANLGVQCIPWNGTFTYSMSANQDPMTLVYDYIIDSYSFNNKSTTVADFSFNFTSDPLDATNASVNFDIYKTLMYGLT